MSAERSDQRVEIHPGVREVEHTADLGMEVEAGSLEQLFHRAAAGTMALVRERHVAPPADEVRPRSAERAAELTVELAAENDAGHGDVPGLLVRWLRELLYLQEVDGFVYAAAEFERLDEHGLRAIVRPDPAPAPQIRELKGVTYHGLEVGRKSPDGGDAAEEGWRARVIFDI